MPRLISCGPVGETGFLIQIQLNSSIPLEEELAENEIPNFRSEDEIAAFQENQQKSEDFDIITKTIDYYESSSTGQKEVEEATTVSNLDDFFVEPAENSEKITGYDEATTDQKEDEEAAAVENLDDLVVEPAENSITPPEKEKGKVKITSSTIESVAAAGVILSLLFCLL